MKSATKPKRDRLRILVLGYIVRGPIAGMTWHHIQYVIGLKNLGHEVTYYEESGDSLYCCYHPDKGTNDTDPTYGLQYFKNLLLQLKLDVHWIYFDFHKNIRHTNHYDKDFKKGSNFDVLINISASNHLQDWMLAIPKRLLIDTDPVFTQIRNIQNPSRRKLSASHNVFFTFGENILSKECGIPYDGFQWKPTRQPVVLEQWPVYPDNTQVKFTGIMQWESYPPLSHEGIRYGLKADSFHPYLNLPTKVKLPMEIAMGGGGAPRQTLRDNNWQLINPIDISQDPCVYQDYIQNSTAEFSVAKEAYVKSNSGWFSERSTCYLASARPVLAQDTGFSSFIETGTGLLGFNTPEEAIYGIEEIHGNYKKHSLKAREIIQEFFNAEFVLNRLLDHSQSD